MPSSCLGLVPVGSTRVTNSVLTAAEEMLRWQRLRQLVFYTRDVLGYRYLLVGDNASQLACHCLAGIAQGRGGSVATELVSPSFTQFDVS